MTPDGPAQNPPAFPDHRGFARREVLVAGRLLCDGAWQACEVINLSAGGARLRVFGIYCVGQELSLEIEPCGRFPSVAAWVRGEELGLKFTCDPAQAAEALIALATFG